MNVNGFKWWRMDSNGMFMPCPSGAGQLAIYLGCAQDTNQLPDTTLGKTLGKYIENTQGKTLEKHWASLPYIWGQKHWGKYTGKKH